MPFLDLDRLIALLKEPWPLIANGAWVESKDKTHPDLDLSSKNRHLDRLVISNFIAWPLDLTLIHVAGVSTAGIYMYVTTFCVARPWGYEPPCSHHHAKWNISTSIVVDLSLARVIQYSPFQFHHRLWFHALSSAHQSCHSDQIMCIVHVCTWQPLPFTFKI